MANPHIAFLTTTLGGGGAERAMANLASELAARGKKVTVLTLRSGGAYEATLHPAVNLVNLNLASAWKTPLVLSKAVEEHEIDILFSALFHLDLYVLLSRPFWRRKAKVAICFQNTPSVVAAQSAATAERLQLALYRRIAKSADIFFAISQGVADDAAAFFGLKRENLHVIPNPIVDPRAPAPVAQDLRGLFKPPVDKILIASGRLTKQKDYPTLLSAFADASKQSSLGLIILGEGELKAELVAQIETLGLTQKIHFAGFQQKPLDWLSGADLFVLSSRWEGLANVLVEALWCGLPVVSTDCPYGPSEVLGDGQFGRLTPVGDPVALSVAILQTLSEPVEKETQKQRALKYSIGPIADQYERALS